MKKTILLALLLVLPLSSVVMAQGQRVLVYSRTTGYRHASIETGKLAIIKLGRENGFGVDTTENAGAFTASNLARYNAVIFLSTTHDVLNDEQQDVFRKYIEGGGGFVGIHAAADTEYDWPWYGDMLGAWFLSHPEQQEAKSVAAPDAHFFKGLPDSWVRWDEWYNYKNISGDIKALYLLDESSYKGGKNADYHPIVWYHDFHGGRVFYTGFGHTAESYSDTLFLVHLLQGIQYAMGPK